MSAAEWCTVIYYAILHKMFLICVSMIFYHIELGNIIAGKFIAKLKYAKPSIL